VLVVFIFLVAQMVRRSGVADGTLDLCAAGRTAAWRRDVRLRARGNADYDGQVGHLRRLGGGRTAAEAGVSTAKTGADAGDFSTAAARPASDLAAMNADTISLST
jgi:hypothetical protein